MLRVILENHYFAIAIILILLFISIVNNTKFSHLKVVEINIPRKMIIPTQDSGRMHFGEIK